MGLLQSQTLSYWDITSSFQYYITLYLFMNIYGTLIKVYY